MLSLGLTMGNNAYAPAVVGGSALGGTAKLTSANGTSKSRFADVATPFFQFILNNGITTVCPVRATASAANTQHHIEWQVNHLRDRLAFGYDDNTVDFNATGAVSDANMPGNSVNAGVTLEVVGTGWTLFINGTGSSTGSVTLAAGDYVVVETDTVAKTITFYKYSGTTATLIASGTLTTKIPSTWWAFTGGGYGDATVGGSDAVTFNPGSSAFAMTPNTGFNNYYA